VLAGFCLALYYTGHFPNIKWWVREKKASGCRREAPPFFLFGG
jgi:hypothetical protein